MPLTSPSTGTKASLCAGISLGATSGVDFRAEAIVLGWGYDKSFPLWDGAFDYPGANFQIGDC